MNSSNQSIKDRNITIILGMLIILVLIWTVSYIGDLRIDDQNVDEGYQQEALSIDDSESDFSWRYHMKEDGFRDDLSNGFDFMYFSAARVFNFSWPDNDHELFLIHFAVVFKDIRSENFLVYQKRFTYTQENYTTPISFHFQPDFKNPKGGLLNPVVETTYGIRFAEAWGWIYNNGSNRIWRFNEGSMFGNYNFVVLDTAANIFEWQISDPTNGGIFAIMKVVFLDSPWWQVRLFLKIVVIILFSLNLWLKIKNR